MELLANKLNRISRKIMEEPTTPVAPPKRTPVKPPKENPQPSKEPSKTPKWDPNKKWLPKPGPTPTPKNIVNIYIVEDYEAEVEPSIQQFWKDLPKGSKHIYSKNPVMAIYGDMLSKAGYAHISKMADINTAPSTELIDIFMRIMRIELQHTKELEDAAIQIVSEIWKIPKEMLKAKISNQIEPGDDEEEPEEEEELDQKIAPEVQKRITLNTMTQGAAVHSMITMHHLAKNVIEAIDPQLMSLYDKFTSGSHRLYWMVNYANMLEVLANMAIGSVKLEFEKNNPRVVATALSFPILIQELVKGVMELLTYHHLGELDPSTAQKVIKHADKVHYEPWQIQIGPELWRRFLKVANTITDDIIDVSDIVGALSIQPPDDMHKIIMLVLDDKGEQAANLLSELVKSPEQFDVEEYEDENEDWR